MGWDADYHCACERPDEGYAEPDMRHQFWLPLLEDGDEELHQITITIKRHYTNCPECGNFGYLASCSFRVLGPEYYCVCSTEQQALDAVKAAFPKAKYDVDFAYEARMRARGIEY